MSTTVIRRSGQHRLGYFHCTLTGAAVLGVLFLLCWATAAIADVPASKAFLGIFMQAALSAPPEAMAQGLVAAVLAGGLIGGLIAVFFNVLAFTNRR